MSGWTGNRKTAPRADVLGAAAPLCALFALLCPNGFLPLKKLQGALLGANQEGRLNFSREPDESFCLSKASVLKAVFGKFRWLKICEVQRGITLRKASAQDKAAIENVLELLDHGSCAVAQADEATEEVAPAEATEEVAVAPAEATVEVAPVFQAWPDYDLSDEDSGSSISQSPPGRIVADSLVASSCASRDLLLARAREAPAMALGVAKPASSRKAQTKKDSAAIKRLHKSQGKALVTPVKGTTGASKGLDKTPLKRPAASDVRAFCGKRKLSMTPKCIRSRAWHAEFKRAKDAGIVYEEATRLARIAHENAI